MSKRSKPRAFTLIELLVVIAIIALLISILLPSLRDAREQGKRAVCLANMRSIGQASHAYATEDEREHPVPIQMAMVSILMGQGFTGEFGWRTMSPFSFGGQTPTLQFPGQPNAPNTDPDGHWAGKTRPMNLHMYGKLDRLEGSGMKLFRCHSDRGYGAQDLLTYQHTTDEAIDVPCFDYLGNSYRFNIAGYILTNGGSQTIGHMAIGPWGHRLSSLEDTGRLVNFSEPLFYAFSLNNPTGPDPDAFMLRGWHNQRMTDNVEFADGSARSITVGNRRQFEPDVARRMRINTGCVPQHYILRRGRHWRMDCWPVPGAWIRIKDGNGGWLRPDPTCGGSGWPDAGAQQNMIDPEW